MYMVCVCMYLVALALHWYHSNPLFSCRPESRLVVPRLTDQSRQWMLALRQGRDLQLTSLCPARRRGWYAMFLLVSRTSSSHLVSTTTLTERSSCTLNEGEKYPHPPIHMHMIIMGKSLPLTSNGCQHRFGRAARVVCPSVRRCASSEPCRRRRGRGQDVQGAYQLNDRYALLTKHQLGKKSLSPRCSFHSQREHLVPPPPGRDHTPLRDCHQRVGGIRGRRKREGASRPRYRLLSVTSYNSISNLRAFQKLQCWPGTCRLSSELCTTFSPTCLSRWNPGRTAPLLPPREPQPGASVPSFRS